MPIGRIFFPFFSKADSPPPEPEHFGFSLSFERLIPGVDNFRYDVSLSPFLRTATATVALQLIARAAQADKVLPESSTAQWIQDREAFKQHLHDVIFDGVAKAKFYNEIQVDLLARTAVAKLLLLELNRQFEELVGKFQSFLRKYETSYTPNPSVTVSLKEDLAEIRQNRVAILRKAGQEIFEYFSEVQKTDIREKREALFGDRAAVPAPVFENPLLHIGNQPDDFFMIREYVLLRHRHDDPDRYDRILDLIRNAYRSVFAEPGAPAVPEEDIDALIMAVSNVDLLFSPARSEALRRGLKREERSERNRLSQEIRSARQRLDAVYKDFLKTELIDRILAAYEMVPVFAEYCPPLSPHQILEFLINPGKRRFISNQLRRLRDFYGKEFSTTPLRHLIRRLKRISRKDKKSYLIKFIKDFSRYHRDSACYGTLHAAMESIHLLDDPDAVTLSRANRTLYEFARVQEQSPGEEVIRSHVILKADIRGSTRLTQEMNARGLNPASLFSLNFFDPITRVLSEYGAEKVFLEGDAMILSISERENVSEDCYSVSRACGLSLRMLAIIRQYIRKSGEARLPAIELGIGISYQDGVPTYLFDGERRIMISPAINQSDRLSGCSKVLRRQLSRFNPPFNLYVFRAVGEGEAGESSDDPYTRYNVNGIELSAPAFRKLGEEIALTTTECRLPDVQKEPFRIHYGKFPKATGLYQSIIVREGRVVEVSPATWKPVRVTDQKYYEVCTHPRVWEYVASL